MYIYIYIYMKHRDNHQKTCSGLNLRRIFWGQMASDMARRRRSARALAGLLSRAGASGRA